MSSKPPVNLNGLSEDEINDLLEQFFGSRDEEEFAEEELLPIPPKKKVLTDQCPSCKITCEFVRGDLICPRCRKCIAGIR